MKKITIEIAKKLFTVEVADTEEQQEEGLQNRTSLKDDEGMLFIFPKEEERSFWMKNTDILLDIIFINEDLEVTTIHEGMPNSLTMLDGVCTYVLEVNAGSDIKVGDELNFKPKNKKLTTSDKMLVLDLEGKPQMKLDGGERIFSRKHTKTLIQFAKKAAATENDNDYKALGKRMFKFLQAQKDTAPEYVESKN